MRLTLSLVKLAGEAPVVARVSQEQERLGRCFVVGTMSVLYHYSDLNSLA